MEFLQLMFTHLPVITSTLVLVFTAMVVIGLLICSVYGINFTLNSNAWGKEVISFKPILDKVCKPLKKMFTFKDYNDFGVVDSTSKRFKITTDEEGKYYFKCVDGYWMGLDANMSRTDYHVIEFETKQDAINYFNKNLDKVEWQVNTTLLLIPVLIEFILYTFTLAPLLTIITVSTATLVMSVRWVSGKLANNVKNTGNNTKRIDDIEEKLKDE